MGQLSISQLVLSALRRIIRAMDLRSRQLERSVGLTVPQLVVLKEVGDANGLPVGQLARRVSLSQATVTTIVDRLEQRQAVERRRDPVDRRKVQLYLTPSGEEILRRSPTILQEEFLEAFEMLEDWEKTQILSSLQRVARMMKAEELPATPLLTAEPLPGLTAGDAEDFAAEDFAVDEDTSP